MASDPDLDPAQLTVTDYLEGLAARTSAPAGGVAAALLAAQAAALLAMAARFTAGRDDQDADEAAGPVAEGADRLRRRALELAAEDVRAFGEVRDAWQLPKGEERDERVREAMAGAAEPPAAVVGVARELVTLAEQLLPFVNPTVAADLAAATDAAHAAASTSRRNVESNLTRESAHRLLDEVTDVDELLARAIDIGETVRRRCLP
jgi:formiminotetrahydrofolate cyclodeaminase